MAELTTSKQRMEWIDALRGFTMILVVAYHICNMGFEEEIKTSASLPILVLFRMPLFFFISGFLAYKPDFVWTGHRFGMMVWKKVKIQLLPTIVFLLVAIVVRESSFEKGFNTSMASPTKGGYWFTWVLLWMFIIYYLFSYLEMKMKKKSWVPIIILWLVALAVYATVFMPKWFNYAFGSKEERPAFYNYTCLIQLMQYFHLFLFGNIVHRYWNKFQKLLDSNWFMPVLLVVTFIACADFLKWHNFKYQWTNLPRTVSMYSLMLIVFMFFRYYKDSFTKDKKIGAFLQYIGVRTLDIYLLHFLFLPHLRFVGDFFESQKNNFVLEVTVQILAAILVIAFCIVISNTIRISPILKKLLFGRETKKKDKALQAEKKD